MKALMGLITGLMTVLSIPLTILNMLGAVVSGFWLAFLGEWRAIGIGILLFAVSTLLLGFALMPAMLFEGPALSCRQEGKTFKCFCFFGLSSIYILGVITIWCCAILFLFVKDATTSSLIPRLVWSYGVAITPWAYMASQDQGPDLQGFASIMATFFAELAYIVIILLLLFSPITFLGAIKVFGGFMAVWLILQVSVAVMLHKEEKTLAEESAALYE